MRSQAHAILGVVAILGSIGCNEHIYSGSRAVDPIVAGTGGVGGFSGSGGVTGGAAGMPVIGGRGGSPGGPDAGEPGQGGVGPPVTTCDPARCPPLDGQGTPPFGATGCCTATGACGLTLTVEFGVQGCVTPDLMGVNDMQCLSEVSPGSFGIVLAGCCRADNRCGVRPSPLLNGLALGCIERVEFAAAFEGTGLVSPPSWSSRPCMFTPMPISDLDGGVGDGG